MQNTNSTIIIIHFYLISSLFNDIILVEATHLDIFRCFIQHLLVQPLTQAEKSLGETPGQASMHDLKTASGHPPEFE